MRRRAVAVEPQRAFDGTLDFVMVFFFKRGPGPAKGAGVKTLSGTGAVLEPWWIRGGTMVEPWWIHRGTVMEPLTNLVEPRSRDGLGLCVFEDFACPGPRPTGSYIILRGDSTHANVANGPRWQRPGRGEGAKPKPTLKPC